MWRPWLLYFFLLICCACGTAEDDASSVEARDGNTLFRRLTAEETGMEFTNTLVEREDFDVFRYRNYYNGGGVAIADFNNDSLSDVYITSNMGDNKLFINRGSWKFEDVTAKAGVKGTKVWSTGVSIVDINADGLLDIYVCNAGDVKGNNRENELFINNGNLTFTEKAVAYGLADRGFSTHAAFLDYDKDGDLDCYVLNNSYRPVSTLGYRNLRNVRDEFGGHKLYRNDNNRFTDVSVQAGIYGSVIGFGLGVTVGDVNQDNWPDLYISNDFYERDYLYINNHDGTFKEQLEDYMGHISMFSMGADLADLNNDSYPEIFSTDMLPEDDYRLKTLTAFETYDVYQLRLRNGYYHQFMRNMLHRNNGDGTFSEIGTMAGMEATDWSWGALIADFNNDRYKEVYVCNGIYKDLINQDFIEYLGSSDQMRAAIEGKKVDFKQFVEKMPSVPLANYMFTRTGEWQYQNVSEAWGLAEPGFSNGAAYGDLDNDGDLDLVVNNVNMPLFVYRNQSREQNGHHALTLSFRGTGKNSFGLGASVRVYLAGEIITMENMPIRGFQSSMDYKMVIGMGTHVQADSLLVIWPDDKVQTLKAVQAGQTLVLHQEQASAVKTGKPISTRAPLLRKVSEGRIRHEENPYNDFDRDRLSYHMLSTQGPALATGDVNGDGLDDLYLGGSVGSAGKLYLQAVNGDFSQLRIEPFEADTLADIVDAAFFDADGDNDLDLYAVTGGSEHTGQSIALKDILYINEGTKNGRPMFSRTAGRIPDLYFSGSCVRPADADQDGDTDLFIGTRVMPSYYGMPCDQFMLINDGRGNFSDATATIAPQLKRLGMVTDAVWFDYDANGFKDLMVVGDWMPVTIFSNNGKQLVKVDTIKSLANTAGWWNTVKAADLDRDGDTDFVLGNLGQNTRFQPGPEAPLKLYVNDFDQNGSIEPVFAYRNGDTMYPMALRQDLIRQMSSLKKKFVYYKDYAGKSISDIFEARLLERATTLEFNEPRTGILVNEGGKGFRFKPLPVDAQVSPVYAIEVDDVNADGHADILLGGNLFAVKPEVGRHDALHGLVLLGDGRGTFDALSSNRSGIRLMGEVRHIARLKGRNAKTIAFVRNNDSAVFYQYAK